MQGCSQLSNQFDLGRTFFLRKGGVSISAVDKVSPHRCGCFTGLPIVALPVRTLMRIFLGIFHNFHISLIYFSKRAFGKTTVIELSQLFSVVDLNSLLFLTTFSKYSRTFTSIFQAVDCATILAHVYPYKKYICISHGSNLYTPYSVSLARQLITILS